MLSEKINNELNSQINKEFYAGYLYLSMSDFFREKGLYGFAHWCKKQSEEELEHGMKIFNFLSSLNAKINFSQVPAPNIDYQTPIEAVKGFLNHEKYITESLRNIAVYANEENAFLTQQLIAEMLQEQLEEEATAYKIYMQLKNFSECKSGLHMLDKELSTR